MDELTPAERSAALKSLANRLQQWHLGGVASLLFGMGRGASVVTSHLLMVIQPLTPISQWRSSLHTYALALEDDTSWQELLEHLGAVKS